MRLPVRWHRLGCVCPLHACDSTVTGGARGRNQSGHQPALVRVCYGRGRVRRAVEFEGGGERLRSQVVRARAVAAPRDSAAGELYRSCDLCVGDSLHCHGRQWCRRWSLSEASKRRGTRRLGAAYVLGNPRSPDMFAQRQPTLHQLARPTSRIRPSPLTRKHLYHGHETRHRRMSRH
jgi:hypothetical protein